MPEPIIDVVATPAAGSPAAVGGTAAGGTVVSPATTPSADWRLDLPEDIRFDQEWEKFKGADAKAILPHMAKSYLNAQHMIGREKLPMPKSDSEWADTWNKLGRPERPDGYKFERPAMPEGVTYDEEGEKAFRTMAHNRGMSQREAQGMLNDLIGLRLQEQKDAALSWSAKASEYQTELKKELGQAYEPFTQQAGLVTKQFGGEAAQELLKSVGLDNHPVMVSMMGKIARELMGVQKLKGAEPSNAMTPAEYGARINDFRTTHNAALIDNRHPDHARRVSELNDLYAKKHGG